jgi:ABC-type transport system substrate-binding protein
MPSKIARGRILGRAFLGISTLAATLLAALPAQAAGDPVLFSFATLGDSRTDPAAADPTTFLPNNTGTLLPQDRFWLNNTKAFSRILRTIGGQKPNLLFFNGDMIYGYGRPIPPR